MKIRLQLVTSLVVGAFALSGSVHVAAAQRTLTIEELARAEARRLAVSQATRDAQARADRIKADHESTRARLSVVNEPIPGLPFIKPQTVVVTNRRVVFMYQEPDVNVTLPKRDRQGHYVWRWNMTEGSAPFSLVLTADTAMRTSDFGDIVKASRVRRCNSTFETQALACKNPVDAFVTRQGQGFRIEVSDSLIFQSMKAARPRSLIGLTFSPLGRSVSATYTVMYTDPKVKADR